MKLNGSLTKPSLIVIIVALFTFLLPLSGVAAQHQTTLDKILSDGTLTVSCQKGNQPFAFEDPETGKMTGFGPELARGFANALEVDLKVKTYDWAGIIPSLMNKKVDMIVGMLTRSVLRSTKFNFTDPVATNNVRILVRKESDIESAEDVNQEGVRIVGARGVIWTRLARKRFPKAKVVVVSSPTEQAAALHSKRGDVILDGVIDISTHKEQYPGEFKVVGDVLWTNVIAFATRFESTRLLRSFNTYLREIKTKGRFAELYKKWFGWDWSAPRSTRGIFSQNQ